MRNIVTNKEQAGDRPLRYCIPRLQGRHNDRTFWERGCALVSLAMLTVWFRLTSKSALSGYRYSAGNAMGIVVVVDWEQGGCCALHDQLTTTQPRKTSSIAITFLFSFAMAQNPAPELYLSLLSGRYSNVSYISAEQRHNDVGCRLSGHPFPGA
jgi:hypothetical protein